MKNAISISIIKRPLLFCCSVFVIVAILTQYLTYQRYLISKDNEREEVLREINSVKDRLKTSLSHNLSATKTLAFIVENYGVPKDFDGIAKEILNANKNIDAIQLTRMGVITNVYPLKGNENVIGYDILKDTFTNKEAYKAIKKKELFFAGPFELKQGGIGIVGRLPIFVNNTFCGFSAVIIKLPALLKAVGIDTLQNNHFIYQLSKVNPNTKKEEFFLPNSIQFDKKHSVSVEVPDGEWKIYVMPKNDNKFFNIITFSIVGLWLSLITALFAWYLAKQPEKLNKLVEEKTSQLITTQNNYKTTLNRINDGMVSVDNNWRYTFLNDAALITHPEGRENTLGKIIWEVHPEMKGTIFWEKYHEAMETKNVTEIESYYTPMNIWFLVKIYPSPDGLTIFYTDITDRKKADKEIKKTTEQLRQLTSRLQNIREEERTRIAREIHDELGQQLTGLKMDAFWIGKKIDIKDQVIHEKIAGMISLIDDTIITVRRIASELRPSILDDLGLIAALEWQGQEFEKRTGIKSYLNHIILDFNPEKELSTTIFRVYQEALTNITRHAHATQVETTIEVNDNYITLIVKDNGCGIDLNNVNYKNSLGLIGMKERALLFQGELAIESQKLKGTIIILKIPLLHKNKTSS